MSQLSLNLIAISIFTVTMTILLGPLLHVSPFVPTIATAGALGLATLDTFSWRGQGSALLLDWLAGFSADHRDRVVRHEAGHFLIAHLLEIPVTGYALSAWEALKQGHPGFGGVRFDTQALEIPLQQKTLTVQMVDRYCLIWMAGIAAETLVYGEAQGGGGDREQLQTLLSQLGFSATATLQKERLSLLQAKTLLQEHWVTYEAIVTAMTQRLSVAEVVQAINQYTGDPK